MKPLDPNEKLDLGCPAEDLEHYRPRRKGWHWRELVPDQQSTSSLQRDVRGAAANSIPLPAAHYFEHIDPQPDCVVSTEIASGRFEDDLRRMRMAAWHGADHLMVIRTDRPEPHRRPDGGHPGGHRRRPRSRASRSAPRARPCDLIEAEVGRPLNFHSYVSGVAGPEIAVLFAEEGVNGAHQDPQYNVLYRNVNMYRSFVDAGEAKRVMASAASSRSTAPTTPTPPPRPVAGDARADGPARASTARSRSRSGCRRS